MTNIEASALANLFTLHSTLFSIQHSKTGFWSESDAPDITYINFLPNKTIQLLWRERAVIAEHIISARSSQEMAVWSVLSAGLFGPN